MEKITYPPLIEHLKRSGDQYNQVYREYGLRYHAISPALLSSWIVNILQPVVAAAGEQHVEKIFPVMYNRLLALLGSQWAITYEQEYRSAWQMLAKNPHLMQTSPSRVVDAINSALVSLRKYQPGKAMTWIAAMDQSISSCKTTGELLACGRIWAWLCGMAHLRGKAIHDIQLLTNELRDVIENSSGHRLTDWAARTWQSAKPQFAGVAGGFAGLGGAFKTLPTVALVDNQIVASDDTTACAVFTDFFGSVLISGVPVSPHDVDVKSSRESFKKFLSRFGAETIPFDDVTSSVLKDNTLVLTRQSSFHLFIYGWHA